MRKGRIVIMLAGRRAGKKAVIVNEGKKERKFGHALVVGIDSPPKRVTRAMNEKKLKKRSKCKPFVKFVNYNHLLPTRFMMADEDFKFKDVVSDDKWASADLKARKDTRKELKKILDDR